MSIELSCESVYTLGPVEDSCIPCNALYIARSRLLSDGCVPPTRTLSTHIPHFVRKIRAGPFVAPAEFYRWKNLGHPDKHRIARRAGA